ncbi:MAG: hypothetical protein ACQEUT_11720 [Bacillota bacterium]
MSRKPKVISLSGVSGSGKTTVTKALEGNLKDAKSLFFDDYTWDDSPQDPVKWVKEGADYNQWNLEPLFNAVMALSLSEEPPTFILLDYPFSYQNHRMKTLIDLSIYIDTPLDVAMGRRIIRDYKDEPAAEIQKDIKFYIKEGRAAYREMETTIKRDCDFIVDGTLNIDEIVNLLAEKLNDGL